MEDKLTVSQVGLRYGIIVGLIFMIYGMILQFLNLDVKTMQYFGYVNYIILIAAFILAHRAFKTGEDGFMSYGQGLSLGVLISLISGILSSFFSFVYIKFIDDSMLAKIKNAQIEELQGRGMEDAQIEQAMAMSSKIMTPEILPIIALVMMLLIGFVLALIISIFTKNTNPVPEG